MLARSVMLAARPMAGPQPERPVPATPMPTPYLSVDLLRGRLGGLLVQVDADDVRAFLHEAVRGFLADAGAGADHDDDLAGAVPSRRACA